MRFYNPLAGPALQIVDASGTIITVADERAFRCCHTRTLLRPASTTVADRHYDGEFSALGFGPPSRYILGS